MRAELCRVARNLLNIATDASIGALLLVMALDSDLTLDDASCTAANSQSTRQLMA